MTTEEAAAQVGVSPATVRDWVRLGYLKPVRPGANPLRFLDDVVIECALKRRPKTWHDALDRIAARLP